MNITYFEIWLKTWTDKSADKSRFFIAAKFFIYFKSECNVSINDWWTRFIWNSVSCVTSGLSQNPEVKKYESLYLGGFLSSSEAEYRPRWAKKSSCALRELHSIFRTPSKDVTSEVPDVVYSPKNTFCDLLYRFLLR